jgi:serine/threonine-protein kinase
MIGTVLGERYEMIEKIGGGGMAEVYKARCRLLNRYVAVKVLREEWLEDEEFIQKFNTEAQSVARLSHQNIVSIYDVGKEGDYHYIVMEYVDGITLKDKIMKERVISWEESLDISMQICFALEHAHKNKIIHRDIKPHNIILTKDGLVKVTDFGIARVASSATMTYGCDTVGSVHYFSPEQARGGYTDEKTDIYSLGIVMYEMVTGSVPFNGDSHVSVAMKQIQDEPVPLRKKNKSVPEFLEGIILKAMQKEQSKRYQSIADMIKDIDLCYDNPNANFDKNSYYEDSKTQRVTIIRNINGSDGEMANKKNKSNKKTKKYTKGDKIAIMAAIIVSLFIVGMLSYFGFGIFKEYFGGNTLNEEIIPDIQGKNIDKVKDLYRDSDFTILEVERKYSDTLEKDMIISQQPEAGTKVKLPNTIEVVVSRGVEVLLLPDFTNIDYRQAEIELDELELPFSLKYESSDEIPNGYVIRQNPESGSEVSNDQQVVLYVSSGPKIELINMPDLRGMILTEAEKKINDLELKLGEVTKTDSDKPKDTVISQSIEPNQEVEQGTIINISVSNKEEIKNERFIKINLPQNKEEVSVKLVYHNGSTESVVYEKVHQTSEKTLTIPVTGTGTAFIQVYLDDVLVGEDVIDFGGESQ